MHSEDWDSSRHVVDHVELHASDYRASISFYATVLAPLGIPSWSEDSGGERVTCFTRVNVVDRHPPTRELHLCFVARSREEVEAFHGAGVEAGRVGGAVLAGFGLGKDLGAAVEVATTAGADAAG